MRTEALSWIRFITETGQKVLLKIDPVKVGEELLDYFSVEIMQLKDDETPSSPPKTNTAIRSCSCPIQTSAPDQSFGGL